MADIRCPITQGCQGTVAPVEADPSKTYDGVFLNPRLVNRSEAHLALGEFNQAIYEMEPRDYLVWWLECSECGATIEAQERVKVRRRGEGKGTT